MDAVQCFLAAKALTGARRVRVRRRAARGMHACMQSVWGRCQHEAIKDMAKAAAARQLGAAAFAQYEFFHYIMPAGLIRNCGTPRG